MTTLVTGGLGAIGSFVVRELHDRKEECIIFDLGQNTALLKGLEKEVKIVSGDVCELSQIVEALKSYAVTRIIHTASILNETVSGAVPEQLIKVNIGGTANIFTAARIMQIPRVVFCSTKGVYGAVAEKHGYPDYEPITEDYPKNPHTVYDAGKWLLENYAGYYNKYYGTDIIALRFSHTFGPGKVGKHGWASIVSQLIENAVQGRPSIINKGGEEKEDFIYNGNSAHALVLAAFAQNLKHRVFHIGSGTALSLCDIAEEIRKIIPEARIEIGPGLDFKGVGKNTYMTYNIQRAEEELGYKPRFSLHEALVDYMNLTPKTGGGGCD